MNLSKEAWQEDPPEDDTQDTAVVPSPQAIERGTT